MGGLGQILGDVPVDGANAKGRMRREGAFAGRRPTGTHRASNQSDPEGIDNDAESGATKKKQPDTGDEKCRRAESLPPNPQHGFPIRLAAIRQTPSCVCFSLTRRSLT
ncbi:MAG: hypothetical protein RIC82_03325, partial [Parvibaculum sp.]